MLAYLEPYGYPVDGGYFGRIRLGEWMLFPTENEYLEYFEDIV